MAEGNVLLVEGDDDQHVTWALCKAHNVPQTFEVITPKQAKQTADGFAQQLRFLENLLKKYNPEINPIMGFVMDADENLEQRWAEIGRVLVAYAKEPYTIPTSPDPLGTILPAAGKKTPRLGFWLMPNNQSIGKLEDFLYNLIPPDDPLNKAVEHSLMCIEQHQWQKYAEKDRVKAHIHTWLAWQEEPGIPMGRAITRKFLTPHTPTAGQFANWLTNLFT